MPPLPVLLPSAEALSALDIKQAVERLEKARGLGRARHRHQFRTLFFAIRNGLAECLLYWACQSPLGKSEVQLLLDFVSANSPLPPEAKTTTTTTATKTVAITPAVPKSDVIVDEVSPAAQANWTVTDRSTVLVLMAGLWALDVSQLEGAWDSSVDRDIEEEEKAGNFQL